jgi:hypothetical protein
VVEQLLRLLASLCAPHGSRRLRFTVGAVVGLSLATLGAAIIAHARLDPDESQHLHAAWLVAQGRVPYADFWEHHMPLFHYALAPVTRRVAEGPAIYFAGRAIMSLTAVGTLVLVYVLGHRLGPGVGAAAVILLAVQFRFLQHSIQVRPDGPALLTWLVTVLMLVRWREHERARRLLAAGLWLGVTAALTPKAAFVGLGALAVLLTSSRRPSPALMQIGRRVLWLAAGCAAPLTALMVWLTVTGGSRALREFWQDVIVANLHFPDFIKQTPVGAEGVGFLLLGLAGMVMTLREHGWRVLQHPLHGPLLIPPAVVSAIVLLPSTPAVYSYTWLPVIASVSVYAGQALVAAVERLRAGAGTRATALVLLIVGGALVVPLAVVGILALPSNRENDADFLRMSRELAYACPGEAVLDSGPLAVFRPTALRYPSLVHGLRVWIVQGVIPVDALVADLGRAQAPVGVLDSRLRKIGGPLTEFIAKHYVREPDGLLVAGASLSVPGGAGEADIDLLVPGRYELTTTPGIHGVIDGIARGASVMWLSGGQHRISWSGAPGTLRLAILPCAERSAKPRAHLLAEASHRLHDSRVRQVAVAHLAEDVMHAGVTELGYLVGDALGGSAERGALDRVPGAVLVGDPRIVPRVDARGIDVEVGGVVRRAGMDHVPARPDQRRRQLVLGLALTLRDVDESPQGRLLAQALPRRVVEGALGEAGLVEREPLGHARERDARHQDRRAQPAALSNEVG